MEQILKIMAIVLVSVSIGGLVGFLIGYSKRNNSLEAEIKSLNSATDTLINEARADMKEGRIERNVILTQQKLVLDQLKIYDQHFNEQLERERKIENQKLKEEKKSNTITSKIDSLKNKNTGGNKSMD